MEVTPGCGHRSVSQSGLDKVDGTSSLERVAGVGVPQPMGTHRCLDPGSLRSGANYAKNLRMAKRSTFARSKDRRSGIAIATEPAKLLPGSRGQEHGPRLPALSKNRNLPGVIPLLQMLPRQCEQFEHSQASSVKEPEKRSIASARLKSQNLVDGAFTENAL